MTLSECAPALHDLLQWAQNKDVAEVGYRPTEDGAEIDYRAGPGQDAGIINETVRSELDLTAASAREAAHLEESWLQALGVTCSELPIDRQPVTSYDGELYFSSLLVGLTTGDRNRIAFVFFVGDHPFTSDDSNV